jgi:hypothetical protein
MMTPASFAAPNFQRRRDLRAIFSREFHLGALRLRFCAAAIGTREE